jgi:RNA recognition motif-containing protein
MTNPETGYSSGFAFVEMTNAHEAGNAISHLHGTIVWEQPIQVEESGPRLVPSTGQLARQNRA